MTTSSGDGGRDRIAWKADLLALSGLVVAITLLFAPALVGWLSATRDLLHFSLPARALWRSAVLAGHLPAWNPYVGLGFSPMASPVHGTFYPGNLLLLLGQPGWSVPFCWFVHTVWAGVGAYAVARILGCRPAAALLAGLTWSVGGYAVSMWENGEKVLSSAWIPWAILGLMRLSRQPRILSPWLAATAAAMAMICLAGDPFLLGHTLFLGLPLACATVVATGRWPSTVARVTARSSVAVFLALLLASVALWPAFSLMGLSERAGGLAVERAELWSLHPVRLLEFVAPGALGNPLLRSSYPGALFVSDPGLGFSPWALSLYAGAAVLLLAGMAGRGRVAITLWVCAALALLLALGRHTPIHGIALRLFPPLQYMRYPEKHVLVTIASLGWLAAMGAERVWRRETKWPRLPAAILVCAALAPLLAPAALRGPVARGLGHFALATLSVAGALWLSRRRTALAWLVPAVAACDLLVAAFPLLDWFDGSLLAKEAPLVTAVRRATREAAPPRLYRPGEAGTRYDTLPHNLGLLFGIAHVPGHDSARPASFHRLWDKLSSSGESTLSLLGVEWAFLPETATAPTMKPVARDQGWQLLQSTRSVRARLVHRVEIADDQAALARLGAPDFDPNRQALVAPETGTERPLDGVEPAETCIVDHFAMTEILLHCAAHEPGLLVLAEQFFPGWNAEVDGQRAAVVRADLALRGVFLAAGQHQIRFHFEMPGLGLGLALSVAGLLLCLALVLTSVVGGYRRQPR